MALGRKLSRFGEGNQRENGVFSLCFALKKFGQLGEERKVAFELQMNSKDEDLIIKEIVRRQNPARFWPDSWPDSRQKLCKFFFK